MKTVDCESPVTGSERAASASPRAEPLCFAQPTDVNSCWPRSTTSCREIQLTRENKQLMVILDRPGAEGNHPSRRG